VGSGKTTTLYAMLHHLIGEQRKIVSIEEHVHTVLDGVNQVDLKQDEALTYPRAIRAAQRSLPDVLMVGELTSLESIELSHEVALNGSLVLSTLHTSNGIAALQRLRDVGVSSHLTADVLRLVCSQRLVRTLCPHCAQPVEVDEREREELALTCEAGGLSWDEVPQHWHRAVGCERCHQTGYRGRSMVCELLELRDDLREALLDEADETALTSAARRAGIVSLEAEAIRLAGAGTTTVHELRRFFDV